MERALGHVCQSNMMGDKIGIHVWLFEHFVPSLPIIFIFTDSKC